MFSASCSVWALITVTLRCHHNGDDKTIKIYKEQKNVTVKCNTAARQTRKIKTFQLDIIYLNPALHFFMSGEHQSSETLNWMYLVTEVTFRQPRSKILCAVTNAIVNFAPAAAITAL